MENVPHEMFKKTNVLIVEDSAVTAMELQHLLTEQGYEVVGPAATLSEGELLADEAQIDKAILDINLYDENVFPLARKLKDMKIPFIFLTGYNPDDLLPADFTGHTCISKPYIQENLLSVVEAL